ncbi:MAG: sigma 54-interacting transcriptional regulator [Desulfobacteraceae bacterium]|jgi:transcriptional regulator with GAF, ATPase, and Fis domain
MPTVIVSRDSQFVSVFHIRDKTLIGRSPTNDIVLDAAGISRIHACIEQQRNRFFLIDDRSTNGTFIGDQRIRRHLLTDGTSFRILDYLLTFVEDAPSRVATPEDLATATLIDKKPQKMLKTLWLTQQATPKKGLQQKVCRLLKMVNDLISAPGDADPGALVLDALMDITGAKRGILAMKGKRVDPVFTHTRGFDLKGQGAKVSRTIFQRVLGKGSIVYLRSAGRESPTNSVYKFALKSVLCVPLITGEQTVGCIYLDHPDYTNVFSETDRDLVVAAAEHVAEALLPDKDQSGKLAGEDERLAGELAQQGTIARSPKTLKVFRDSRTIARYNVSVLIFGETGTGKEIIARYIHDQSGRRGKFIARNCSAIAGSMFESELFGHEKGAFTGAAEQKPGMLELADRGTLFLDEIGDMPAEMQAKLLRALQEQEVWRVGATAPVKIDVRVIAATHKDIKSRRKQLNFRDDLYYRLANVEITAPSLRERPEDIAPLCEMVLETFCQEQPDKQKALCLSPKALRLLEAYDWPGNIRELRNTLIQISLRCDGNTIEPRHLKGLIDVYAVQPKEDGKPLPSLMEVERVHIIKALKCTDGNKSAAAKILDIDRNRLNRRLKKLGID